MEPTYQELRDALLEVTGQLFRWTCEMGEEIGVDWPKPTPTEASPTIEETGRKVEKLLGVKWGHSTSGPLISPSDAKTE